MRVRVAVALLAAPCLLVGCGERGDGYLFHECPTVSAEDQATMEKMVGPADDQPGAVDGYATYFTLICR